MSYLTAKVANFTFNFYIFEDLMAAELILNDKLIDSDWLVLYH